MSEPVAGRYRIERVLGTGGLATTYAAVDAVDGEQVALKLLRAADAGRQLLRGEFAMLLDRCHPRLTRVRDFGQAEWEGEQRAFYTADLIEGRTLAHFASEAPESALRAALIEALSALAWLHDQGVRHGDFKPANIMVDRAGRGVLIDLSCAHPLSALVDEVRGTPGFVAPELRPGARVDARADLYGVGQTLRSLPWSDPSIDALAARLCATRPADRPTEVAEVIESLGGRPLPFAPAPPLLEREQALQRGRAWLDAVCSGRASARTFCLHGSTGSGRTRLLALLRGQAQLRCEVQPLALRAERPLHALLERAVGRRLTPGVSGVLEAHARLTERESPCVLVVDDSDTLAAPEQSALWALARSLDPKGPVGLLCVAEQAPELDDTQAWMQPVGPLSEVAVQQWCAGRLGERECRRLHERTGGSPALVAAAVRGLHAGQPLPDVLRTLDATAGDGSPALQSTQQVRALCALALCDGRLTGQARQALGIRHEALEQLEAQGRVERREAYWALPQPAASEALRRTAPAAVLQALRDAYLGHLARQPGPAAAAERIRVLLDAGQTGEATHHFEAAAEGRRDAPWLWRDVAVRLSEAGAAVKTSAAEVLLAAGDPAAALKLLGESPTDEAQQRLKARALLHQGQVQAALQALPPDDGAANAELRARACMASGAYSQALAHAEQGLKTRPDGPLGAALSECAGLACGYLGRTERARELLEAAALGHDAGSDTRAQVRVRLSRGIVAFLAGDWSLAVTQYGEGAALAETQGLDDQLANAVLNLGTAHQQAGDWAAALSSYERALNMALALGRRGGAATLRFNLANLYTEVGLFDRAQTQLEQARRTADDLQLGQLDRPLQRLRGELALYRGEYASARRRLTAVRKAADEAGAPRERAEADLYLVEVALAQQTWDQAALELAPLSDVEGHDLQLWRDLCEARLSLGRGQGALAASQLQALATRADDQGRPVWRARVAGELSRAYEVQGATALASEQAERARQQWESVVLGLPRTYRDAFVSHPFRAHLWKPPAPGSDAQSSTQRVTDAQLERFVAVNRALTSSLSVERVLDTAIDAAIELTGAERGFVVLREGARLQVAAARNLDRERVGKSHQKLSHSIAREVMDSDRALVTVDAQSDGRLTDQASVHALRLKSVACVPIRSADGVLGAVYLDNRFGPGLFAQTDVRLLQAFADQVAIALTNARLHSELKARSQELERAQAQIKEQLAGRERQVDALSQEVRARQDALEFRYDYSSIAGQSPALRTVLATLERVIDTDLPIVVQGESGTGKELVARAVHFNSPRKDKRMSSINCAALPDSLLESELFGHVRGAFTGADRDRQGLLAAARGGTVFLDELGEMSMAMQAKLLRVLQEGEVLPVGADATVPLDVRLVCATNRDLEREVEAGRFREDLYYRVGVVVVHLPPLRQRLEDLPLLIDALTPRLPHHKRVSEAAMQRLYQHSWPGNVRELENVLSRAAAMADGDAIEPADLALPEDAVLSGLPTHRDGYEQDEARRLQAALVTARWNISRVSRELGIPRQTLYRKLDRYGLRRPRG